MASSDVNVAQCFSYWQSDFEHELSKYGEYLAMRGAKPGEQRFGVPELALAVLGLLVWTAREYLKTYLQETAKYDAQKDTYDPSHEYNKSYIAEKAKADAQRDAGDAVREYAKSYMGEMGKLDTQAHRKLPSPDVEKKLDALLEAVLQARGRQQSLEAQWQDLMLLIPGEALQPVVPFLERHKELVELLKVFGLTERVALKAATSILTNLAAQSGSIEVQQ